MAIADTQRAKWLALALLATAAVRHRPRRLDRERRTALDRQRPRTSPRTTCPGSSTPTRSSSAASCCSAAASPTCLGRRRMFIAGLVLFARRVAGSAAWRRAEAWLIIARAVQGLGAALVSPAALSIVTTTFTEGAERNRALGVWGAVAGSGGAAGVLLGGVLTKRGLGVGAVRQHPDRPRRRVDRAAPAAREPRRAGTRDFDVAGARVGHRRPGAARLHARGRRPAPAGARLRRSRWVGRRVALLGGLRRDRARAAPTAGAVLDLPAADAARARTSSRC